MFCHRQAITVVQWHTYISEIEEPLRKQQLSTDQMTLIMPVIIMTIDNPTIYTSPFPLPIPQPRKATLWSFNFKSPQIHTRFPLWLSSRSSPHMSHLYWDLRRRLWFMTHYLPIRIRSNHRPFLRPLFLPYSSSLPAIVSTAWTGTGPSSMVSQVFCVPKSVPREF